MGSEKNRVINERFYDAYLDFDEVLCGRLNVKEDGVKKYQIKMKECYTEARDVIPEWDVVYARLKAIRARHQNLTQGTAKFDEFQGKDEDVVWMQIFCEKLDADADPLSKYSKYSFEKRKHKGFFAKLMEAFSK
ncbi:DUF6548 family protein [Pseudobutyrivibrio xylanivorans]|uniref:Uncharacterized protein n=1 Tax=Pseudobutyrivibrio xylanivorans TaxID=185007 RepID=A0A5P6VUD6_PSEXY|nr:DUF6548 family protein [Pseudobutyrivibrio xylanivorans]QFJ56335.1 hypothetical protein FXF36_15585 [Pseudobutyrivibrio xylanivorans]